MEVKTELEWSYQPQDFFEERLVFALTDGELVADAGKATLTLTIPTNPVFAADLQRYKDEVCGVFEVRQLITHNKYELNGPDIKKDGTRNLSLFAVSADLTMTAGHPDLVIIDASGKIVNDTKAERLASDMTMMTSLSPKLVQSTILHGILRSYSQAVRDPQNELVHLYEIRDAIAKEFGGESGAKSALGITRVDWSTLGRLANDQPLLEGRHRGQKLDELRPATQEELAEARRIACKMIQAYAEKV